MKHRLASITIASLFAGVVLSTPASAFPSFATAHLNLRTGPGTQYPVLAAIDYNQPVEVHGCLRDISWCDVNWGDIRGWAAAEYLAYDAPGQVVQLPLAGDAVSIPVVTYEAVAAVVSQPVGVITALAYGTPVPAVIIPPGNVLAFMAAQTVDPVYLTGEVVVGVTLPTVVPLYAVPQSPYHFAYVNGVRVLVEEKSRHVVYIYR